VVLEVRRGTAIQRSMPEAAATYKHRWQTTMMHGHVEIYRTALLTAEENQLLATLLEMAVTALEPLLRIEDSQRQDEPHDQQQTKLLRHEMNNVVTNMEIQSHLLGHYPENLGRVLPNIQKQIDLLRDILTNWRLEGQQRGQTLNYIWLDLNELTHHVLDCYADQAQQKEIALLFEPTLTPPLMKGVRSEVQQMIGNLVSNAIKYSAEGSVSVQLDYEAVAQQFILTVSDSGMGITAQDLPHIFDYGYRGERATGSPVPGTGFGLHIVRTLVERYGGSIEVQSVVNVGSAFTLRLPLSGRRIE
jgi:signal transduction histidine kinase